MGSPKASSAESFGQALTFRTPETDTDCCTLEFQGTSVQLGLVLFKCSPHFDSAKNGMNSTSGWRRETPQLARFLFKRTLA